MACTIFVYWQAYAELIPDVHSDEPSNTQFDGATFCAPTDGSLTDCAAGGMLTIAVLITLKMFVFRQRVVFKNKQA